MLRPRTGITTVGMLSPSEYGVSPAASGVGVAPRWYNPLNSAAIDARIAAGGLWAWRAQANDNVTWGPGPANYAASLIDLCQGQVLAEIGGGPVNWAAATGWSGFLALLRCLDTGITPDVSVPNWIAFVQFTALALANASPYGMYTNVVPQGAMTFNNRAAGTIRSHHGDTTGADNVPPFLAGNYALAGKQPYRDGVAEPIVIGGGGDTGGISLYVGARNLVGVANLHWNGEVQAVLICDDMTAFAPADIAAIAALPAGSMHNL